jgi:outer membrane protein assembly factor BamB
MEELDAPLPMWGFSASPLVTHDKVIVYADGRDDHGLVAYDAVTGAPAWHAAATGMNYASAQLVTLAGVELVLFTSGTGLLALAPRTGERLWHHAPSGWRGGAMVQPQPIGGDSLIVPLGDGIGVARIDVERDGDTWEVMERWSSRRLKPSFNDFVHHDGFLYGFDQSIFTCVDAETGARVWRKGRYGFGQVLLLDEADALLVSSESGEIILVAADPTEPRELARIPAVEGKTWNHPVVAGDRLFVRNGVEAACFALPVVDTPRSD